MKTIILSIIITCCMVILLPILAGAAEISWSSESYRAYSYVREIYSGSNDDEMTAPSPPVSAFAYYSFFGIGSAYTEITSSSINVTGDLRSQYDEEIMGTNTAEFLGTYTATLSYFLFSYDNIPGYNNFNLTVKDMTTSSFLYNAPIGGAGDLFIPTTAGNNIEVVFDFTKSVRTGMFAPTLAWDETLTYSMTTVVPEPISSILFVTGGSLLAGRRFIKRKNKA